MSTDQLTFQDPTKRFPSISPPPQEQEGVGQQDQLEPTSDIGLDSYRGTGRLVGRKALITGGDSGIGAATAIAFAREGADVAINYLAEEQEDAERIRKVIEDAGQKALLIPGDLTERATAERLVAETVEAFGQIDILVNNAGKQQFSEQFEDISDEQFDETYKTNVYAMFWLTKAALPHIPAGSSIINTTSIQAYAPSDILVDYASTKAAINAFTKGLAASLAPRGIRVNGVAPGPVWTPLEVSGGQPPENHPTFGQDTPLGRAGQPTELAPAFVFLASSESSFVVGETLNVNGGSPTP